MFALKKIVGFLLMPLSLSLLLVCLGLLLLALRRRRAAWLGFGLGLSVLLLTSNRAVSTLLCASLETRYAPAPLVLSAEIPSVLNPCDYIVVLGSGHGDAKGLSAAQRLCDSARARLMEGLRLARLLPDTRLVVSGPRMSRAGTQIDDNSQTHARVLADAAVELGFPRERILEIDTARDTAEETAAIAKLAGKHRIALVTSAWHLPRAMRLARHEGLNAVACPSDYLGRSEPEFPLVAWVSWDADSLNNSTRAWREYIGLAWTSITGKSGG
ncbi:MAG: hypothetical protein RIQ79_2429 [Verrucomicrobiota bacterium]